MGEITAPWVKVLAENGYTGWAFSGYLETKNPETQNSDLINANPTNLETENVETANPENTKSGFPVLPFAIIGGVILVSSIAAIAVLAKRKKG
jgi:hypothetical protein